MPLRKSHRTLLAAATACAAVAFAPAAASASTLSQNLTCAGQAVSSPFAKWGDFASYWLAPGGDFETGSTGWTMSNATIVAGNDTLGVKAGTKSLKLGGASLSTVSKVTTPPFCVDPTHPQFKFTVKSNSATTLLTTYINFRASTGSTLTVAAKLNTFTFGQWAVSASQPLATQIPALFLGTGTTATITFKAISSSLAGSVNVDNVMIDPYRRG